MATIHWLRALNGVFGGGPNWAGGIAPGASDAAILDAAGSTAYTVTVSTPTTVAGLQTASDAVLYLVADLNLTGGTGSGANSGGIQIQNGATLSVQGTVVNIGTIEIFGGGSPTTIEVGAAGLTLTGGGGVFLDFQGGAFQQIVAAPGGAVLNDVDNRISGQGLLGGPGLTLMTGPKGFIEAKAGLLTIDTGANTIVNAGTIDAEGLPNSNPDPAAQGIVKSPVANDGLLLADGDGASLIFERAVTGTGRAVIAGGTLQFDSTFSQSVAFEGPTGVLVLEQSQGYAGVIAQFRQTGPETLDLRDIAFVGVGEASYSGVTSGGRLTVTDGAHTASISFQGDYTQVVFVAAADGLGGTNITTAPKAVDWARATSGSFQTGAYWAGGVAPGPHNDAILGADGGTQYTVTASGSEFVAGVAVASNAVLGVTGAFTATSGADGGSLAGRISIANGGALSAGGTLAGSGVIELNATTGVSELVVMNALTLSGGGVFYASDAPHNAIFGAAAGAVLTNVDDAIIGAGNIGVGRLILINQAGGRIEANQPNNGLIINTGANTVINAGFIEGAGAGLRVLSAIENDGLVEAVTTLVFSRAVTGSGRAVIHGAAILQCLSAFDQTLSFVGTGGTFELAQSRFYGGVIYGFSTTGADTLDLADIKFTGPGEATFSGTTASGVLSVSDGIHAAHIQLHGNYTRVAFTATDDGHGGTLVTTSARTAATLHLFAAAISGELATSAGLVGPPIAPPAPLTIANPSH